MIVTGVSDFAERPHDKEFILECGRTDAKRVDNVRTGYVANNIARTKDEVNGLFAGVPQITSF